MFENVVYVKISIQERMEKRLGKFSCQRNIVIILKVEVTER